MQAFNIKTRPILAYWFTLMGITLALMAMLLKFLNKIDTTLSIPIALVILYLSHLFAKFLFEGKLLVSFTKYHINFDWKRKPVITERVFQEIRIKDIQSYVYHDYKGFITIKISMTDGARIKIECPSPSTLKNTELGKLLNHLKVITKRNG